MKSNQLNGSFKCGHMKFYFKLKLNHYGESNKELLSIFKREMSKPVGSGGFTLYILAFPEKIKNNRFLPEDFSLSPYIYLLGLQDYPFIYFGDECVHSIEESSAYGVKFSEFKEYSSNIVYPTCSNGNITGRIDKFVLSNNVPRKYHDFESEKKAIRKKISEVISRVSDSEAANDGKLLEKIIDIMRSNILYFISSNGEDSGKTYAFKNGFTNLVFDKFYGWLQ